MREKIANEIAKRLSNGDTIGVGTGSTVDVALDAIHTRVKAEKLSVQIVPSSYETAWRCESIGLQTLSPLYRGEISWGFDGADEVDPEGRLIKGRGGALLQEKILAAKCRSFIVIVDSTKCVQRLGQKSSVPVEVIPQAVPLVERGLKKLGATNIQLRQAQGKHGAVVTEGGNLILDASFSDIPNNMERDIKALVGVVESGLFFGYTDEVIIGETNGTIRTIKVQRSR